MATQGEAALAVSLGRAFNLSRAMTILRFITELIKRSDFRVHRISSREKYYRGSIFFQGYTNESGDVWNAEYNTYKGLFAQFKKELR